MSAQQVMTYTLSEDEGTIVGLAEMLQDVGRDQGWSPKCVYQLTLALDEIVTNILEYGYDCPEGHEIRVILEIQGNHVRISIQDNAAPFNPLKQVSQPEVDKPVLERRRSVGGMGVHLVKNLMDTVTYRQENGKNVLILEKNITQAPCECPARRHGDAAP